MHNAEFVNALKEALNGLRTVHMVGEEWVSYVGDIPTGGVPYCGQEVNRSTYSALWEYANAKGLVKSESEWQALYNAQGGNVAYYSSGNSSSTFRIPRLVGYVRGASSQSESGSYVKEGLPNITGAFTSSGPQKADAAVAGAFGNTDTASATQIQGGTSNRAIVDFDASRCSTIYGNSSHVTPETSVVLYGVYAFGELGNVDALDATTLASAVARVESNLINPARYIVEKWSSGANWYVKFSDGWIEQGGAVTPSSNTADVSVTLNVAFSNTNYTAFAMHSSTATTNAATNVLIKGKTVTGFTVRTLDGNGTTYSVTRNWVAFGY